MSPATREDCVGSAAGVEPSPSSWMQVLDERREVRRGCPKSEGVKVVREMMPV